MKKLISIILALLMAASFTSVGCAIDSAKQEQKTAKSTNTVTKTVTDSDKNKYSVYCYSSRAGKKASSKTQYSVTYVYGGTEAAKQDVYKYKKTLGATATVSLSGGGANSYGSSAVIRTGETNSYSPSNSYLYTVTAVLTNYSFSCNGGSYSATTYM